MQSGPSSLPMQSGNLTEADPCRSLRTLTPSDIRLDGDGKFYYSSRLLRCLCFQSARKRRYLQHSKTQITAKKHLALATLDSPRILPAKSRTPNTKQSQAIRSMSIRSVHPQPSPFSPAKSCRTSVGNPSFPRPKKPARRCGGAATHACSAIFWPNAIAPSVPSDASVYFTTSSWLSADAGRVRAD